MPVAAQMSLGAYDIARTDAEGVGKRFLYVGYGSGNDPSEAETAARLLCLAYNLDGGIERALALLRAETVRQRSGA